MRAGGFGNSPLLARGGSAAAPEEGVGQATTGALPAAPEPLANPPAAETDTALQGALVRRAAAVRDITGAALEKGITVREVRGFLGFVRGRGVSQGREPRAS